MGKTFDLHYLFLRLLLFVTPHAQHERGNVIDVGVHIYVYSVYVVGSAKKCMSQNVHLFFYFTI